VNPVAALRAVASECQTLAAGFSDEEAAEGLAIIVGLRAVFKRPASTSAAAAGPAAQLLEFLSVVLDSNMFISKVTIFMNWPKGQ